ncbi:trypsin-like peptidase domain-containing protein [Planococcus sp. N064]|uniref:Trypsin-like peptidase domain-containing protein n=1 Tax=Planococcus liqunii TaxID=3058394 RepID=A0ABT8MNI7_9BACL|nr:trypsin-like peptidase domain-containing protein [Planococcus sp. N064]MDN7226461.1 trypsin-like peptidase domain-containing protein [Planococcus sp. N064]
MNSRKSNRLTKKNNKQIFVVTIMLVILAMIGLSSYFLLLPPTDAPPTTATVKQQAFAGKAYTGFQTEVEEIPESEVPVEGKVQDVREEEPPEEKAEEKTKETAGDAKVVTPEQPVAAPQKDLSLMIANAKTHVYTLYTDLEQGSGFLFNEQGDVLTNAHVVKDASYVTLKNSDGQEFNGQVIGISETKDIALVRVKELAGKTPMPVAAKNPEVGTKVVAIGSPEDQANTATEGEVTATGASFSDEYEYTNMIESTATLKKGSSGGPLIDTENEQIIGINSIILEDSPKTGYAIPISTVMDELNEWVANPIEYVEEEVVLPDVKDSYFDEELLGVFIQSYYELLPYSLNDPELVYYQSYLLPGSEGETEGIKRVEERTDANKVYDVINSSVTQVEIGEEQSTVEATAEYIYHDKASNKTMSETETVIFTVVIDAYGDYQIQNMVSK